MNSMMRRLALFLLLVSAAAADSAEVAVPLQDGVKAE